MQKIAKMRPKRLRANKMHQGRYDNATDARPAAKMPESNPKQPRKVTDR
jgi:hypothetical protein